MAFSDKAEQFTTRYKKPNYEYRDFELVKFGEQLAPYRVTKKDKNGVYSFFDLRKFLEDNKATKNGAVVVLNLKRVAPPGKRADEYILDHDTTSYEIYMDKYEQYVNFLGRKQYAKRREMEELDITAATEGLAKKLSTVVTNKEQLT